MALTYGLMEALDAEAQKPNAKVRVLNKAKVTELIRKGDEIVGVKYEKDGKTFTEMGPVIICTGGFGADFTADSLLASIQSQWRTMEAWQTSSRAGQQNNITKQSFKDVPSLMTLPTTNGPHCTGDGIKLALGAGATTYDLHAVQVHPTGLIDPSDKDNKVKFLAAEALRGSGGIVINSKGEKFCDDLGKRDYVTMRMWQDGNTPHRLILNSKAREQIAWHCEHYEGRGLMKALTGEQLAKEMGIPLSKLRETFGEYNEAAKSPEDPVKNKWGKKYFHSMPWDANDKFMVAQITPVVHYCMGGVAADEYAQVLTASNAVIPGLYVAGEAQGGVHGVNRLGGSSLLDCVVYGRISGKSSSKYLLDKLIKNGGAGAAGLSKSAGGVTATVRVQPGGKVALELDLGGGAAAGSDATAQDAAGASSKPGFQEEDPNAAFYGKGFSAPTGAAPAAAAAPAAGKKTYTMDEVKKHTKDTDCWVILHNEVYDVTKFLNDHPGGKKAIMLYAGKDATTEFDMLHSKDLLARYGPEFHIGALQGAAKL
jgi:succinate dehydrogenase/fumarate reductase flavoprotein subunit